MSKEEEKKKKKILYYVRHGENRANITREFSYKTVDYPLTERGVKQALATAEALGGEEFCAIFCSPLKRAVETAEIIGRGRGLSPLAVEGLREVNVGLLEGREPIEENWRTYNSVMKDWREGRHASRMPGGENFFELSLRAKSAFLEILGRSADCGRVVVVGHGGILLSVLPQICENADQYDLETLENCSISTLELAPEPSGILSGRVLSWRACDHLRDC